MRKSLTAAEAKTHFAESLRLAEAGAVVEITRYGRLVAALVGAQELGELERFRASIPQQGLAGLVGRWDDGDDLADEMDRVVAGRSQMRGIPEFES
jgi:prevent-host-death family protein